jgi:hypothetical protein
VSLSEPSDGVIKWCWTRRARGQFRWQDKTEVPLIEQEEAYVVGFGPPAEPIQIWELEQSSFSIAQSAMDALVAANGPQDLWVRQFGTFGSSVATLLAKIS